MHRKIVNHAIVSWHSATEMYEFRSLKIVNIQEQNALHVLLEKKSKKKMMENTRKEEFQNNKSTFQMANFLSIELCLDNLCSSVQIQG